MWERDNDKLIRSFKFRDFSQSFAFISRVALLSERLNHHPEILIEYNKVTLTLCTHDDGNRVTAKDMQLADQIDKLLSEEI